MSISGDIVVEAKNNQGDEKRIRTVSAKGKVYQQELLLKRRKSYHNRLIRQLTLVAQCLESTSVEMTNQEVSNMDQILSELVETNLKYINLLDEEDAKDECYKWFESIDNVVFEMKANVCTWLKEQDNNDTGSRSSGSSRGSVKSCTSVKSRNSRKTVVSCRSRRSNRSDTSNASSTHSLQNKAHLAGLKVEISSLQQNWELTLDDKVWQFKQGEESRMKKKLLKLKEDIAITEAKQEVYDDGAFILDNDTGTSVGNNFKQKSPHELRRKRSSSMFTHAVHKEEPSKENRKSRRARSSDRYVKTKRSDVKFGTQSSPMAELSQAVIEMMMLNSAPNVELDIFSGKILEFEYFKANFKELVEAKVKDQRGRLARLLKYTSGDAKELIKGCVHEDSDTCYDRAMFLLNKEYGDLHETTCAYLKELHKWPSIRNSDAKGYKSLYRFLLKCQSFKNSSRLAELDSTDKIRMVLSKFAIPVQETWNRNACKIREGNNREANFDDLVSFIDVQCRLLNNPSYSRDAFGSNTIPLNNKYQDSVKSLLTTHSVPKAQEPENHPQPCLCCRDNTHFFEDCPTYLTKPLSERRKFVFQNRLCFACLAPISATHYAKTCAQKKICKTCSKPHPTCLHFSVLSIRQPSTGGITSLPIIPVVVHHKNNPEQCITVYAMLDDCSQGTFIKESVLHSLYAAPIRNAIITVETLNSMETSQCSAVDNLVVTAIPEHQNRYQSKSFRLPTCYTQDAFPIDVNDIPSPVSLSHWPHLARVSKFLHKHEDSPLPIGLLIGANCPKVLEPHEVILSQDNGPYAFRSCLGWCIVGPVNSEKSAAKSIKCNTTVVRVPVKDASTNDVATHHFAIANTVKECVITSQLNEMYMHDFNEVQPEKKALSGEDIEFLRQMDEGIMKEDNGHYGLPLPFRNLNVNMPNNRAQAVSRAEGSLKKRMKGDQKFHSEYTDFMKKVFNEGYVKKVADSEKEDANVWYIPHHAVYHPQKEKIRVVFDCGARFQGRCLNDELLQGPDLANLIIGVLIRFRKEEVAVQADLTGMFFQIFVPNHHQKFLRFVFWPDGNLEADLEDYQMCVHIFGAKSSTSCCIYALRRTAVDNKDKYSDEVCETILNNFYVDDLLKSYMNNEEAISQILEIIELCKQGGFDLSKFVSNKQAVIDALPEEKKASSVREMDLGNTIHIERALGVLWYVENDMLGFRISMENTPLTRRGMLSTISSAFDPFGGAGPFLIKGKRILQLVNSEKKSWDEPVSDEHAAAWQQWRQELLDLSNLVVDRCYKPTGFGKAVHSSLHCFSDASDIGYGQATYLRQENEAGDVAVALVMAKSRVAPIKVTTIPRLELVAATVSVKVAALVKEEIQIDAIEDLYYTDSEIVLGYIGNEVKRYRTFVANRCQIIKVYTEYGKWRHVTSQENPADLASRGIAVKEKEKVSLWIHGPEFLKDPKDTWKGILPTAIINDDDPEVKNNVCVLHTHLDKSISILSWLEVRISRWEKMVRILVYMFKAIAKFRKVVGVSQSINTDDLDRAEKTLVWLIQQRSYAREISVYKNSDCNGRRVKTRLSQLDPFLDENGLLRVGGRLGKSVFSDAVKHPIILPSKAIATDRLVQFHHQKVHHSGRTTTVGEIRQSGFWIVNINSCVRNVIFNCVPCRRFRGELADQKMADLPDFRTFPEGPFVYTGVDMFGPFLVKEKRSQVKRYVAMFTCLSSRAVHLETTKDMSADSFIQALRRFLARRGSVKSIRSDNGTNFVGAETELKKGWEEMDHQKVSEFLLSRKCDWICWERNPPAASHMGGVWERQIRTIRNIMTSLLRDHSTRLDDESLQTLLCEAECIVNSRPITPENVSDVSCEVLTPNHLLTMKSKIVLPPPGIFQKEDIYCRKRWRAIQHLSNQFWTRWKKEYLATLQQRNKWTSPKRNFQINDVVLIKEESTPRNQWPMGRVINVITSNHDELVRTVDLRCSASNITLRRPIHKLVLLLGADEVLE